MAMLHPLGALALGLLSLGGCNQRVERLSADGPIIAAMVPQPPVEQQGDSVGGPVFFVDQARIDELCGGKGKIIACATVNGTAMALPNPCQARFRGESYAAVLCHEKGHNLGWGHAG